MRVDFRPAAIADLERLDRQVQRRIVTVIDRYATLQADNIVKLKGDPPEYRLRVGD